MPGAKFTDADREALTVRIQFGGDEVVKAKAGAGSATLSMAYAGFLFTEGVHACSHHCSTPAPHDRCDVIQPWPHAGAGVIKALKGESVTQCAYVESTLTDAAYFASPCKFGRNGVEEARYA